MEGLHQTTQRMAGEPDSLLLFFFFFFSFSMPLSLLDEFLMNNFEKNSLYVFCLIGFPLTRYFWKFGKMMNCLHMQLFQFISSLDWHKCKQIRIGGLTVEEVNLQLRQLLCASEPELKTSVRHLPFWRLHWSVSSRHADKGMLARPGDYLGFVQSQ